MKNKKTIIKDPYESVNKRLDALIRILLETLYTKKKKFNEATAVRILNSAGMTPTEIAKILGKKNATSVSSYLYSKNKSKDSELE